MRRFLVATIILFSVSATAHGGGHGGLPEPTKVPGDLTYGLERASESISLALNFDREEKVRKKVKLAQERLSESAYLAQRNKTEKAGEVAKKYLDKMEKANRTALEMENQELQQFVQSQKEESRNVLTALQDQLPEEAQQGIENAVSNIPEQRNPKKGQNNSQRPEKPSQQEPETIPRGFIATGRVVE